MQDAAGSRPVCDDTYAARFMDEAAQRIFEPFREFKHPNISNATRHRIIDDLLRERSTGRFGASVVLIGCGFDSRAYRLGGLRWYEFDEPELIAYKNERLPIAECSSALERVPIDFATQAIEPMLAALPIRDSVVVVLEGVLMYLEPQQIAALLASLRRVWPSHTLVCDLMTRAFFKRYSRAIHRRIEELGAGFTASLADDPARIFCDHGYRCTGDTSIVGHAAELGALGIPRLILRTVLRRLRDGYTVRVFESA